MFCFHPPTKQQLKQPSKYMHADSSSFIIFLYTALVYLHVIKRTRLCQARVSLTNESQIDKGYLALLPSAIVLQHNESPNTLLTYLLTSWSRVLLEKLTGSAASQEIPRIFGTRKFLTVPTSARHLSLS